MRVGNDTTAFEVFRCFSADGSSCVSVYTGALEKGICGLGVALRPSGIDNVRYLKVTSSNKRSHYRGLGEVQVYAGRLPEMPYFVAVEQADGASVSLSWNFASASEAAAATRLRILRSSPCSVNAVGYNPRVHASYPNSPTTSPCGNPVVVYDHMRNESGPVAQSGFLTDAGLSAGTTYTYAAYVLSATGWSPPNWRGMAVAPVGEANPNLFLFRQATWVNKSLSTTYGLDSNMNDGLRGTAVGMGPNPAHLQFDLKSPFSISRVVIYQSGDQNFAVRQAQLYVGEGGAQAEQPDSWTLLQTEDLGTPAVPGSNRTMNGFGSRTARHWRLVLRNPNMYMGIAEVEAYAT